MLVIRKQQMAALSASRVVDFEIRMVAHLQRCFPPWSQALGPDLLRGFVVRGMQQAHRYGIETELDIARYLHARQALGDDFDAPPQGQWALDLMNRPWPAARKIAALRDAVGYQLEARRIQHARNG
jgi:hypothetical protein